MTDRLWHTVRSIVADMLAQQGQGRHGIVKSVDPTRAVVRVDFGDTDAPALSGWLPIAQWGVGNGWSSVCLPVPGTQVFCSPDMGDPGHMVVLGAVHSTPQPPGKITPYQASDAVPLVPGEPTLIHSSGASLRLTAGTVEIHGDLKVDGNILASGDITDKNNAHGSLDVLRQDYNQHKHTGVQSGGGTTGLTDHPTP